IFQTLHPASKKRAELNPPFRVKRYRLSGASLLCRLRRDYLRVDIETAVSIIAVPIITARLGVRGGGRSATYTAGRRIRSSILGRLRVRDGGGLRGNSRTGLEHGIQLSKDSTRGRFSLRLLRARQRDGIGLRDRLVERRQLLLGLRNAIGQWMVRHDTV